jgi:hypothetical protein
MTITEIYPRIPWKPRSTLSEPLLCNTNTTFLNTKNLLLCHIHVPRTIRTTNSYTFPRLHL